MRYTLTIAILLLSQQFSFGQNLVTNPGFEQYTTCPVDLSYLVNCSDWGIGINTTPDYYNVCASNTLVAIPDNVLGHQFPASGNAYTGLVLFHTGYEEREFLVGKITALEVGKRYKVSLKTSMAETSNFSCSGLAAYFFVDTLDVDPYATTRIYKTPQIDFSGFGPITDSINWVTLTDTFIADSAYKHIVIGAFKDSLQMQIAPADITSVQNAAYYYIDDISVVKIPSLNVPSLQEELNVHLYPNPFSNKATLSFNNRSHKPHSLRVFSVQGSCVQTSTNITGAEVTIDRGSLSAGCYFYELRNEDGAMAKGKLFIQ